MALAIAGRDIGDLPAVANSERKKHASADFRFFCESYFPLTFHLPWSPDHLKVIAKIEQAVLRGGLFAMAMPRGSGKTTICECACIWAVLNGHRQFVCLIGSDEGHAMDMLESIKMELDGNDLLLEDYPEVVYPIQALDGIANRCNGQLYKGERTHIGWTAREIVLPTMPGSIASGAIIKVAGITGRIRGMKYKRADGRTVRPTLVVLDDPQTDESARSLSQCATRESVLAGAVLGLAGPGQKISGIMPCTVIRPSDMADSILSRDRHPEWNGERTKMVYAFPANDKLWQRYAEIRAESMRQGSAGEEATAFYQSNRVAMDEGSVIAWPERFNHDELSAIYRGSAGVQWPNPQPNYWVRDLDSHHLFEWNFFNSPFFAGRVASDMDGILCVDYSLHDDDDGPAYQRFLTEVPPLYLTRRHPIALIVTSRLEKYRPQTEAWLDKWGVKYDRLEMWPGADPAERWQRVGGASNSAARKARLFDQSGLAIFAESCPSQARDIAGLTGKPVLCPAAGKVF